MKSKALGKRFSQESEEEELSVVQRVDIKIEETIKAVDKLEKEILTIQSGMRFLL